MQVKINNLSFKYEKNGDQILNNFQLEVNKQETICFVGPSGSGKSTVLRLIAGLEVPLSGEIFIAGRTVVNDQVFIPPEKRKVGMVFQDYALFPHLNVAENISFGLGKISKIDKSRKVNEMLDLINLNGFANRYPHQLSGGQQQRIALARTLAPNPRLLLLDEPFSNLDESLRDEIRKELKNIIKQIGITTILVSHDQADADFMADRKIFIYS